jgi:SNF2 family DNA or RNA helicase
MGYEWDEGDRVAEQVREVCDYLEKHSLPYEADPEAARMLVRSRGSEVRLADAIAAGRAVKENAEMTAPSISGMKRPLLPHQWKPVAHLLAVPFAANFSVPGAGKTQIVLATFQELKNRGSVDCLVVVGPGSSFLAWTEESRAALEDPGIVVRLTGVPEERMVSYEEALTASIILVTYHTANNDQERLTALFRERRCLLVLDESHYVKGSGALAQMVLNISPEAERRIILTGTPMPNGFADLWTQATFLWPDQHVFGNRIQFRTRVSTPVGQQSARDRISPLFTRVRKSDLGLPRQLYERVTVSMGAIQSRIYAALASRTLLDISLLPTERVVIREWRRAKMIRLLQAASNPALLAQNSIEFSIPPESALDRPLLELIGSYLKFEMPPKVLAADQLVRNIFANDENEKVVIWTHFVRNIKLLLDLLREFGALPLYGAVPREATDEDEESFTRENHIRAFRNDPTCRVLIANPGAAAESISLHKVCHHAIYIDRTFNAGQFIQSRDRIHRVGLRPDEDVMYHLLMTEGSIDETVNQRLLAKETAMMNMLNDPDLPTAGFEISTNHLSGPDESEEELDFDAVIEDIRRRIERRSISGA